MSDPDTMAQADQTHLKMSMRKVALTALAGTSIEWYDFFLYATAAALVFPSAFFPGSDPTIGLVLSFGTFAFGFIARPLGGIIFGHFGDRVGRKKTLVIALWMMGISSTLIGLLPTYATIGVAAPIILCLLRFAQGLAIGGQWGGAMLLVTESAPADKRGYYGAYAQAGAPVGVILANIAFILISSSISEEAFMDWGWRVPFISSVLLIGISMYVQLHMEDTAAFKELQAIKEKRDAQSPVKIVRRSPIIEALIKYPKRIALAAGAFLSIQVLGAVLTGVWAFALFPLIDTGEFWLVVLGISGGLAFLGLMYGPQAAFFTELFSTEVRYSGASLGYQIGAIVGGAFAPTIATILWIEYDIVWVSVYIAGASLLSLIAVKMLTETYQSSLSDVD